MTLNQLYYFQKLAELENYTKAASALYISQPSLSYSISNLEKELGTPLFQKRGRNVFLSNNGKEFYVCVADVLTRLEKGISLLKHNCDSSSDELNIGTIPVLSGNFIQKNIRLHTTSYPKTNFNIFSCMTNDEVITGINDGVFHIGFCSKDKKEKHVDFVPMFRHELVVITKVGHELSKKEKLLFTNLINYPLITYREKHPFGILIYNLLRKQKIVSNIIYTFDDEITISEMVAQDFGIAVVVNTPILRNFNLAIIPLDVKSDSPILYLAYHKQAIFSKPTMNFIHLLKINSTITCI